MHHSCLNVGAAMWRGERIMNNHHTLMSKIRWEPSPPLSLSLSFSLHLSLSLSLSLSLFFSHSLSNSLFSPCVSLSFSTPVPPVFLHLWVSCGSGVVKVEGVSVRPVLSGRHSAAGQMWSQALQSRLNWHSWAELDRSRLSWAGCSLALSLPLFLPSSTPHHTTPELGIRGNRNEKNKKKTTPPPLALRQLSWAAAAAQR